jgi:hypothetical protein
MKRSLDHLFPPRKYICPTACWLATASTLVYHLSSPYLRASQLGV